MSGSCCHYSCLAVSLCTRSIKNLPYRSFLIKQAASPPRPRITMKIGFSVEQLCKRALKLVSSKLRFQLPCVFHSPCQNGEMIFFFKNIPAIWGPIHFNGVIANSNFSVPSSRAQGDMIKRCHMSRVFALI